MLEHEEKSGKDATPCCTHPITGLSKNTEPRIGSYDTSRFSTTPLDEIPFNGVQFGEPFDI